MKKGNTTYLVIIAVLGRCFISFWSQDQSKKVSKPKKELPLMKEKIKFILLMED